MASRTVTEQPGRARIRAPHLRRDRWWLAPLVTVVVLAGFVVYGTWVAFVNRDYWADPYLSPFYSPCLAKSCAEPTWAIVGSWWPLSPALLVLPFPLILTFDALRAFRFPDGFGLGLGTLVLLVNAALLWLYTLSCHSCRHLCGGGLNTFSRAPLRFWLWRRVSALNAHHMLLAWVSLFTVALADVYVRLVASGAITDLRFF